MHSIASSIATAKHHQQAKAVPTSCWLFDAGPETGFQVYSKAVQTDLEAALKGGNQTCTFAVGGHNYEVDLETMLQRNIKTDKQRAVVRLLLKCTHAVLDRDSARIFPSMSYKAIWAWIEKHANSSVTID